MDIMMLGYLRRVPTRDQVPEGKIVVHSHVRPNKGLPGQPLGMRRFRAWTDDPSDRYVVCDCGWASHLGVHYRVDRWPS